MYIKEVKIENFLSIGNEIVLDDIHRGLNIIAGLNGAGKSNYLKALKFVLTNDYPCTNDAERQSFLNNKEQSATIRITIEDSDNRFLMDKETVTLSRQIGKRINLYFLNDRKITKEDYIRCLERARILFKRPFFIIAQGERTKFAKLSSANRLEVFEDISRQTFIKNVESTIHDSDEKIQEKFSLIDQVPEKLDRNIVSLREELNVVKKYKQLKGEIDSLTRIIGFRRLRITENKLRILNERLMGIQEMKNDVKHELSEFNKKYYSLNNLLKSQENEIEIVEQTAVNAVAKKNINDENIRDINAKTKILQKELHRLNEDEKKKKEKLLEIMSEMSKFEVYSPETDISQVDEDNETEMFSQLKEMYKRRNTNASLDQTERRNFLESEISQLEENEYEYKAEHEKIVDEIKLATEEKLKFEEKIEELENEIQQKESEIAADSLALQDFLRKIPEFNKKLVELRDKLNEKEKNLARVKNEWAEVNQKFRKCTIKKIYDSLVSVERVINIFRERGESTDEYYGILLNNFQLKNSEFQHIIDGIAGNRLFYFVVETTDFALRIIEQIKYSDLPGEANFLPLDRIRDKQKDVEIPTAVNVLSMIEFETKFHSVNRQVFGNTWICDSFQSARDVAREFKVSCFTTDGVNISDNGMVFHDKSNKINPRSNLYRIREQLENERDILETEVQEIKENISQLYQTHEADKNHFQQIKHSFKRNNLTEKKGSLDGIKLQRELELKLILDRKQIRNQLQLKIKKISFKIEKLQNQLKGDDLLSQLTEEEENQIKVLQKNVIELRKEEGLLNKTIESANKVSDDQKNKLKFKIQVTKNDLEKIDISKGKLEIELYDLKMKLIEFQTQNLENQEENVELQLKQKIDETKKKINIVEPKCQELEVMLSDVEENLQVISAKIDKLKNHQKQYEEEIINAKETSSKEETFETQPNDILIETLEKLKQKFLNTKEKIHLRSDELLRKMIDFKTEFHEGMEELKDLSSLMAILRECKIISEEVIEEEFTKLSQNFDKYLQKFFPNGKGELIKITNSSAPGLQEILVGIDMNLEFFGKKKTVKCLSVGDQSCVSIAFIFAAAENEKPPIFIFDEVDDALSQANSQIFGEILKIISEKIQIFLVSFNPNIVSCGNKIFNVTNVNNLSRIQSSTAANNFSPVLESDASLHSSNE
ncbi:structural maintenance of chromosomes protein 3-like [Leptopilina heterotoma]|uniref:structural maintenance of chromosomes protein 3-like n=1 Tax=Leptopilina heterotoma TaxID=63436 RepID=UPI001CA9B131|nr:structural maintenance of chromosomes protein 3-like [Leptopilina heterotoma]